METCPLGMSAPPTEPGEAPPAAAGCQGGRPRARPPAASSQHPDSIALRPGRTDPAASTWCQPAQPRQTLPSGPAVSLVSGLAPEEVGFLFLVSECHQLQEILSLSRGPRHSACPVHAVQARGGVPGPGRALGASTAFSLLHPELHTVVLLCKCSERWGPYGVKRGPLMFIRKQPAS